MTADPNTIAIPWFPGYTALDGIGPYEVLSRIPGYEIRFVGHEPGVVRSDNGILGIEIDATFEDVPSPDIVVFPGGYGTRVLLDDRARPAVGTASPRDDDVHDVGVHGLTCARRGGVVGRVDGDDSLVRS